MTITHSKGVEAQHNRNQTMLTGCLTPSTFMGNFNIDDWTRASLCWGLGWCGIYHQRWGICLDLVAASGK